MSQKSQKNIRSKNTTASPADEKLFRDILLISNDWIWEIDPEGRYTFTSGQIKEILGYSPQEIIGKKVFEIFDPASGKETEKELKKIFAEGKPIINRINWNIAKDGRRVCLLTNGIPVFDENNNIIAYRGADKDITHLKETEKKLTRESEKRKKAEMELDDAIRESREVSQSKSLFLAKMSNEIRTPLSGIIGTAALLKETQLSAEQLDFLEIIDISANNLLSIVKDILDISRIEAGKIQLEKKNFNLVEVLNDIERLLAYKSKDKNIGFSVDLKTGLPKYVKGDPLRLKQVLINLTHNAIKFTKQGSVKITAENISSHPKESKILFSVTDTGIGMPEKLSRSLFGMLSQNDMAGKFQGIGLGLLIAKKIIDLVQGEIGVESTEGKGSRFWFSISFEVGESPGIHPMEVPVEEKKNGKKKFNILVAEDNTINQKVAMATVRQLGHDVEVAVNGKMALELFRNNEYDFILMDVQMPVMDGIAATKKIREMEKEKGRNKKVIIVAVTANAMKEDREKCLASGMDHYITKPFKTEDLLSIFQLTEA
ncbi:MAG: response regulator [Bacteroidota bacterium]|nr:response regulator [Bacteroidota bacterium]